MAGVDNLTDSQGIATMMNDDKMEGVDSSLADSQGIVTMSDDMDKCDFNSDINIAGIVCIVVFYLIVLFIGLWAGWKQKKTLKENDQETRGILYSAVKGNVV